MEKPVQHDPKLVSRLEHVHSKLLQLFVDGGLLARHIGTRVQDVGQGKGHARPRRRDNEIYPVVIGGVNVLRCAKLDDRAIGLLGRLYKNDIDIKFVVKGKVKDNDAHVMKRAHAMRMRFIQGLLADGTVERHVANAARRVNGLEIKFIVDDKTGASREAVRRSMVVSIRAEYRVAGTLVLKKVLMDTGMYTSFSQDYFDGYHAFFMKEVSLPIPYYVSRGVPFATCGWAYYDTVRMLVLCGDAYRAALETGDVGEQRYQFVKYTKYLGKFAVLYTQVNKLRGDDDYERIKTLYASAQDIFSRYGLSAYGMTALDDGDKRLLQGIVDTLQQKTNLANLERAIRATIA
jgi:hypothetical protein